MIDWLGGLIHPLLAVAYTMFGEPVTWIEVLGFVTGGLCVWLTVRRNIWNFPVGIANCLAFLLLFTSARLWADAGLQVVYIALGVAGWWQWLRRRGDHGPLVVTRAPHREMVWCLAFVVLGTGALYALLNATHDSAPLLDAFTTCLSLAAQWLLNGKRIQNWYFWIAADCVYIPLYAAKHLDLTAVVYVLFLAMCLAGLRSWRRALGDAPLETSPRATESAA
ncbi:nicotinamide riboside transporter PnuC [Nocardia sp. NPDC004722]